MSKKKKLNEVTKVTSVKEMLELSVKEAGDKVAFQYKDENDKNKIVRVTYKEFKNDTDELGTAIANIGMADKHIAMIGENSYKWLTVYITVLQSKGVFVPIDKELTAPEIINVLKHGDVEVLFYSEKYEKYLEQIKKEVPSIKYYIGVNKKEDDEASLSYENFKASGKKLLEDNKLLLES